MNATTLADKLWDSHVVRRAPGEPDLLYIDLHLTHEATSPQAFDGLRLAGRKVRRPELTLALEDHNVPTDSQTVHDPVSRLQLDTLRRNCEEHDIELYRLGDDRQGIVHVVAPQLGLVQPGMSVVCGDSHTSTHGAFGALAFGIGTSDVEHALATQTLSMPKPKPMAVDFVGRPPADVSAKDLILALIGQIGVNGAQGHIIEYRGEAVRRLTMEGRMTLCNMSIEAGARAGLIAPDETTYAHLADRPHAPRGSAWRDAMAYWETLRTDEGATYHRTVEVDVSALRPMVTWGTNPGQVVPLNRPDATGAIVLLAGSDFGTGSSREHAVWALRDWGFLVVIASRFGDIFHRNALKNGLLAITLDDLVVDGLMAAAEADPGMQITVDLTACEVRAAGGTWTFEIDERARWLLLNGFDDIDVTLQHLSEISDFEHGRHYWLPTIARGGRTTSEAGR